MKTEVPSRWLLWGACIVVSTVAPSSPGQSTATPGFYAGLTFTGFVGSARSVEAVDALANGSQPWVTLTNFNLPSSPFLYIDVTSSATSRRFYRPQAAGVSLRTYPGLTITGAVGSTNLVQYDNGGTWTTLETVVLPASPYLWVDNAAPVGVVRAYRVVDAGLPPIITSAGSFRAQAGYSLSFQVTTLSVPPVTSYGAVGLPAGLNIDPGTGLISGTPSAVGTNTVTISATSVNGTGYAPLVLKIRTAMRPEMAPIPAGVFTLGSDAMELGRDADEGPTTEVTLSQAFAISVYEITQAEYRDVVGSNPSYFTGDNSRPVEMVTYSDATNYCALLTARDRGLGVITASQVYRLPTEAEWERAARAGTTTAYSFGDAPSNLPAHAWYGGNSGESAHPVGEKTANPWGLYDTYGNCWEMCSDWYGAYPGGSATDPQGPGTGTARVIRGGSWFQNANGCRSANRDSISPTIQYADVGFRVVLALAP